MLPTYFNYIFVQKGKKHASRPKYAQNFVNFRPEPDLKSQARLTTMATVHVL